MFESTPLAPDTTVSDHQNDHSRGCGTLPHTALGWDRASRKRYDPQHWGQTPMVQAIPFPKASGDVLAADRAQKGGSPTVTQVVRTLAR
jgi:hypothetical protein